MAKKELQAPAEEVKAEEVKVETEGTVVTEGTETVVTEGTLVIDAPVPTKPVKETDLGNGTIRTDY